MNTHLDKPRVVSIEEQQSLGLRASGTFVAPAPRPTPVAYPMQDAPPTVIVERVFEAMPGADEKTSGMDRSNALIVRMLPMGCVWTFLAFGVGMVAMAEGGAMWGIVMFAVVLTVTVGCTYFHMDKQERDYSRAGLERHRIDTAARLKEMELRQEYKTRRQALVHYMAFLEGGQDDRLDDRGRSQGQKL